MSNGPQHPGWWRNNRVRFPNNPGPSNPNWWRNNKIRFPNNPGPSNPNWWRNPNFGGGGGQGGGQGGGLPGQKGNKGKGGSVPAPYQVSRPERPD